MLKKNVKLGVALVGMRHLNYKIYLKNNKIYPPHFQIKYLYLHPESYNIASFND